MAERVAFAQSNVASTVVVQNLYEALRDHHPDAPLPLFKQFGITNPVDLSQLHTPLTEQSLELLVTGGLGLGCCSVPTGISFAGFAQPVWIDHELPAFLKHILSHLVVLLAGGRIHGSLLALTARLSLHYIRVLNLHGCAGVTGDLLVFSGMNINILSLTGCRQVTGTPAYLIKNFNLLFIYLIELNNYFSCACMGGWAMALGSCQSKWPEIPIFLWEISIFSLAEKVPASVLVGP